MESKSDFAAAAHFTLRLAAVAGRMPKLDPISDQEVQAATKVYSDLESRAMSALVMALLNEDDVTFMGDVYQKLMSLTNSLIESLLDDADSSPRMWELVERRVKLLEAIASYICNEEPPAQSSFAWAEAFVAEQLKTIHEIKRGECPRCG